MQTNMPLTCFFALVYYIKSTKERWLGLDDGKDGLDDNDDDNIDDKFESSYLFLVSNYYVLLCLWEEQNQL